MKKFMFFLSCFLLSHSFVYANSYNDYQNLEDIEFAEDVSKVDDELHISIKEVKAISKSLGKDASCLDDYLKRRSQLIAKLSVVPVTATVGVMGSAWTGIYAGLYTAVALGINDWSGIGYMIVGGAAGTVASAGFVIYDTTKSVLNMMDNNLMIKTLAEQHSNQSGPKTEQLYQKYVKNNADTDLTKEEFVTKLMELDASGALCDGSLVAQPRFKLGFKLKYKLAKSKDLSKVM